MAHFRNASAGGLARGCRTAAPEGPAPIGCNIETKLLVDSSLSEMAEYMAFSFKRAGLTLRFFDGLGTVGRRYGATDTVP